MFIKMARITSAKTNESRGVPNGSKIRDACEELGVPFSCTNGICGTCMIDIVEGKGNLSELTEQEQDLARDEEHRLACQCRIIKGEVKFGF